MTAKTAAKGEAEVIPREQACPTCQRRMEFDTFYQSYRCMIHGSAARQEAQKKTEAIHG